MSIDIEKLAREAGITFSPDQFSSVREAGIDEFQFEHFTSLVLEQAALKCDEDANKMEQEAQRAIENGELDEVSSIRSTAWKLSVAASKIRAMKP